jgi:phosphoglycolate phosphatase
MDHLSIRLVITDLDNTLYDWFGAFVPAFYAMVEEACRLTGVGEDELLNDLQSVHRRHGNSEHPFALLETRAMLNRFPSDSEKELRARLDPAFHVFNRERKSNLRLYDGVREVLDELSRLKVPVVGYTDARAVNGLFRLRKLGIQSLLAGLYAPDVVVAADDARDIDEKFVHVLPSSDRKPNPQTLRDIYSEYAVAPTEALYIGDSLVRDIYMAKAAGVNAAWAKFGTLYDKSLWPKLVRVTHWTPTDVEREQVLRKESEGIQPDCVLETFSDIFRYYEFTRDTAVSAQHCASPAAPGVA